MAPAQARRIVIGSLILAGFSASVNDAARRKALPHVRIALAAAAAGVVLSAATDFMPEAAAMVAIALAVTSLLDNGTATANALVRLSNLNRPPTPSTSGPAPGSAGT